MNKGLTTVAGSKKMTVARKEPKSVATKSTRLTKAKVLQKIEQGRENRRFKIQKRKVSTFCFFQRLIITNLFDYFLGTGTTK